MKFLARQPIFGLRRDVFGYELLFRSGVQNCCEGVSLEMASCSVLDTSLLTGIQKLTGGRRAFINCPRDFLLSDYVSLLPQEQVVLELLEDIEPDEEFVAVCRRLKQEGYLLALDDFVDTPDWGPLLELADFVKVDFRATPRLVQQALASRNRPRGIQMVAEKVETEEEFSEAKKMGYSLFQGYFFCKPEMMLQQTIPTSKIAYLDLLRASMAPELDVELLASKVKHEASLTFRLLRYLNSAGLGLRGEIRSVPHAFVLLGEEQLRKWIAIVCVAVLTDGKPDELIALPLIRGRFCELLAPMAGMRAHQNDLFLLGLLSVMDVILHTPLETVLAELPVRQEIKDALLMRSGRYCHALDLAMAYERADWERVAAMASSLRVEESCIPDLYVSAVDWATTLQREI